MVISAISVEYIPILDISSVMVDVEIFFSLIMFFVNQILTSNKFILNKSG